jgi:hypothetical protein
VAKLTKQQFIEVLAPFVIRARLDGSPMFPSVRLAQNLLETGGVIHSWNNLGGIKVGSGKPNAYWHGQWVRKGTWEVENGLRTDTSALFRAYDSVYDFYRDQDLLFQLPRYERVRNATTPEQQAEALRLSGYATDPQYGTKIISIIRAYKLTQYDDQVKHNDNEPIQITLNGLVIAEGQLSDNQTWVPARVVGEALNIQIGWNGEAVTANGQVLPTQLIGSTGYVPVRNLVATQENNNEKKIDQVSWNKETKRVELTTI